ncbi:hypothetical protein QR680_016919 [Steinernema hermaphroditum]|uniref:Uncharacterized protein n=1 Tax=Steinernema hermaphroditum TaxID=289476 RepID=A0AA39LN83_9BILA|nr:hypothetical protein QR680_016919 [Steinernema hermaphroditum]
MERSRQMAAKVEEGHSGVGEFIISNTAMLLLTIAVVVVCYHVSVYSLKIHRYYKSLLITSINPRSHSYSVPKLHNDDDFNISDTEIDDELQFYQEDEYDSPLVRKFIRETIKAIDRRKRLNELRNLEVLPERPDEHFIDDFIDLSVYDHVKADSRINLREFDKDGKLFEKAIRDCQENYKPFLMTVHKGLLAEPVEEYMLEDKTKSDNDEDN